jgi:hypothetical protein
MRAQAYFGFGFRCGARFADVAKYGIELLPLDGNGCAVLMRNDSGFVAVVHYNNMHIVHVYAQPLVGTLIA